MTALMEARGVARYYDARRGLFVPHATIKAVDGISFALETGRTLAVVGESGSGKSSLGRVLALLEPPTAGDVLIDGTPTGALAAASRRKLRRAVQMVFQNPYGSLNPRQTVGRILEEPLAINTKLGAAERAESARAMMAKVGLRAEHYARYPHMFSGGQRQRVAIARALMLRPRVVIADEPVSALDVSIRGQILNLLMDLQGEFGLAYVFVSHDLAVVRHVADDVLVMYLGRPAEQGPVGLIFESARHPYTQALLASRPRLGVGARARRQAITGELPSPYNPPSGCAFHARCPHASDLCAAERPALRPVDGRLVACHHAERIAERGPMA